MNTTVERILIFLTGAAIGGAVTYKLAKTKLEKDNEKIFEIIDEEEDALKARIDELETILDIRSISDTEPEMPEEDGVEINPVDKASRKYAIQKHSNIAEKSSDIYGNTVRVLDERGKTDYTAYSQKAFDDDEEATRAGYEHPEEDPTPEEPYVISRDEFINDCSFYAKEDLTYYELDHVLVNSDEEIIDDISGTIGEDALNRFGDIDDDEPDICHVRNDRRSIDYEITRIDASYHEAVLGIYDTGEET